MHPCSHPWYGFIDCENGMSGESLRAMIVRAGVIRTSVLSGGRGSSSSGSRPVVSQPSSTASRCSRRKRFAGLNVAPRPLAGGVAAVIAGRAGGDQDDNEASIVMVMLG